MFSLLPDIRVRQRDYLLEISRALTQELDLDIVLEQILKYSIEILAGQAGLIVLRGEKGGWRVRVSQGISPAFIQHLSPLLIEIPDNENPEQFEIPEINRILSNITFAASMGLLSGVGLPMMTRKKVIGVIFIFRNYAGVFSPNDHIVLSSFANQAAIAVQNASLYTTISRNKQHLDAVLDSAADGILIISPNQKIERCNEAFSRMVAMKPDDIQGKPHDEIVRLEKLTLDTTLEKAIAGGWPLTPNAQLYVEGDLKRLNLSTLPVGITYAPLLSSDEKLLSIIATFRDISRFRQADEMKSTFISVISHELKTPVALIKGYASTLRREDAKWDRKIVDESLKVIEEESDRLSSLIENLLDATRLQAGGIALKKSDIFLPAMVEQLATRFSTQTNKHNITFKFPENFPIIMADDTRIEQVISNLISNAIKYADSGEIHISGQVRPEMVIVCVNDQGPGIAPQDLPFVFDRFYRSPEISRETKGAGLGLYLARSIIEAHAGKIWVDSKPGKGTHICFSLPC
jgi:PAS domain S-box-containing protein